MTYKVVPNLNPSVFPSDHPLHKLDAQITKFGTHQPIPMPPGMGIVFSNGMRNGKWDANESVVDISQSLGNRNVEHVFNDTVNVEKTVGELTAKILEIEQVCRSQLETANLTNDICIIIIAHSHGAGILERSLEDPRIAPLKRNIRIVTIGGAALIPFFGYKSAINLIHEMDFLPLIAHWDIDVKQLSTDSPVRNFFITLFGVCKRQFQEDVLKLTSHKKPALADRIWSAMQSSRTASPQQTPLEIAVNSFCQEFIKPGNKHLNSQTVDQNFRRLFSGIFSIVEAHVAYKIEISRDKRVINDPTQYFDIFHSVKSYIPQLSPLVRRYIREYERHV